MYPAYKKEFEKHRQAWEEGRVHEDFCFFCGVGKISIDPDPETEVTHYPEGGVCKSVTQGTRGIYPKPSMFYLIKHIIRVYYRSWRFRKCGWVRKKMVKIQDYNSMGFHKIKGGRMMTVLGILHGLIEEEIAWCEGDGKGSGRNEDFEEGFVAGLRQAQRTLKTMEQGFRLGYNFDREEE